MGNTFTNSSYYSPSSPLFVKVRALPVLDLVKVNTLLFMYKFNKGILPSAFLHMFQSNSSLHPYPTRQINNLRQPFSRSILVSHSIRFIGVQEWNSLDNNIKSSSTITRFKFLLKQSVFKNMSSIVQ